MIRNAMRNRPTYILVFCFMLLSANIILMGLRLWLLKLRIRSCEQKVRKVESLRRAKNSVLKTTEDLLEQCRAMTLELEKELYVT